MGDQIHDDVERALAAYGGGTLPYRTFGIFSIHPRVLIVTDPAPVAAGTDLDIRDPADIPTFYADEAPAAPTAPPMPMRPVFAPRPEVAAAAAAAWEEPEPSRPAPRELAEVSPVAYVPPPPPDYTPGYDPYHGRLPASAVPAALRGAVPAALPSAVPAALPSAVPAALPSAVPAALPSAVPAALRAAAPTPFVPSHSSPPPPYDARPAQPAPEPVRRSNEMNIFQLAWNGVASAAPADGGANAGPRAAVRDGPLPGAEDLFRRI